MNSMVIKVPAVRQPGHEKDRQKFRKNIITTSRFLDNYFNWNVHEQCWWPNGLYIQKK
jgi:hypothetical protein